MVGFQSASSILKASNPAGHVTDDRTSPILSTSVDPPLNIPKIDQSDKDFNENIKSTSINHATASGSECSSKFTPTIRHFYPSYHKAPQRAMDGSPGHSDIVGSKEHPLVINDDSSSSSEVSRSHSEASHDHNEVSHDHNEVSHDHSTALHDHNKVSHDHNEASHVHIKASRDHNERTGLSHNSRDGISGLHHAKASHDAHMSHSKGKHDKQKVASLVVSVLNPYLKNGGISSKVC